MTVRRTHARGRRGTGGQKLLRRGPLEDLPVGAADRCGAHLDQDIMVADRRFWVVIHELRPFQGPVFTTARIPLSSLLSMGRSGPGGPR